MAVKQERPKPGLIHHSDRGYNTTLMHSAINWQSPREFRRAFEARRIDVTVAATSEIGNESTFNRKPSPKGEDMAESISANQRNISR